MSLPTNDALRQEAETGLEVDGVSVALLRALGVEEEDMEGEVGHEDGMHGWDSPAGEGRRGKKRARERKEEREKRSGELERWE